MFGAKDALRKSVHHCLCERLGRMDVYAHVLTCLRLLGNCNLLHLQTTRLRNALHISAHDARRTSLTYKPEIVETIATRQQHNEIAQSVAHQAL